MSEDASFFQRHTEFEGVLLEEHRKNKKTREFISGAYHYHGMCQYGNILDFESAMQTCRRCVSEKGFTVGELESLEKWYRVRSIDAAVLSVAIRTFLREEIEEPKKSEGVCEGVVVA